MEDVLIFANPIAGRGAGESIAKRLEKRLSSDGFAVHVYLQRPQSLTRKELPPTARAAIVIGGDGTLRAVADQFLALKLDVPPLLTIGMGTANLMARHLNLRWDRRRIEEQVSDAIVSGERVRIDAARANDQLLLLMAGIGFDARVVHELHRMRTGPIDLTSYVLPAALALGFYDYVPLQVYADDEEVFEMGPGIAFVGNAKEYGTGFPVLPLARTDDRLLDVCVLPCKSLPELLHWFLLAAAGEHLHAEGAVYCKASHVRVESDRPLPVQLDGDAAGHTPVEINLLAVQLPFIVPSGRAKRQRG